MEPTTNSQKKVLLGGIALIIVIAAALFWLLRPQVAATPGSPDATVPDIGTTTDPLVSGEAPQKPVLPPWQPPTGSVNIDSYAYIFGSSVYFRSVTGTSSLQIPNSDSATFKRLSDFMSYPDASVAAKCGGSAGIYSVYGDTHQVYFYQVWRTETFKASRIEVIKDAKIEDISVVSPVLIKDGDRLLAVKFEVGTSTCAYSLELQS